MKLIDLIDDCLHRILLFFDNSDLLSLRKTSRSVKEKVDCYICCFTQSLERMSKRKFEEEEAVDDAKEIEHKSDEENSDEVKEKEEENAVNEEGSDGERDVLQGLPDDTLLFIFQYLDTFSLAKVSCVCRKWYLITKDRYLTKHFDLRLKPMCLTQLWTLLRRKLVAETLSVHVRGVSKPSRPVEMLSIAFLQDLKSRCPNITSLSLEHFDFRALPLNLIPGHLERLSLRGSMLTLGWFEPLKNSIYFPQLKHLDLRDCTKLNNSDLEALSYVTSVEELLLVNCYRISARGIPSITASMRSLNSIDLSNCPATNNVVLFYLSRLNLRELRMRFCHLVTDDGMRKLFTRGSSSLKVLDVFACHELTNVTLDLIGANTRLLTLLDVGGNTNFSKEKVMEVRKKFPDCEVRFEMVPTALSECELNSQFTKKFRTDTFT